MKSTQNLRKALSITENVRRFQASSPDLAALMMDEVSGLVYFDANLNYDVLDYETAQEHTVRVREILR